MKAQSLLTQLRRAGVALTPVDAGLKFDGPTTAVGPTTLDRIRRAKSDLIRLVASGWWPDDRARPNLYDLCRCHSSAAVRTALAGIGCDFDDRNPTEEELFVVAEMLGAGAVHEPVTAGRAIADHGLRSLRLKSQLDLTVEEFAEICRRAIGRPGIASARDDDAVALVLLDMIDDAQAERERREERAAILEHDAGFSREQAEERAGLTETSS